GGDMARATGAVPGIRAQQTGTPIDRPQVGFAVGVASQMWPQTAAVLVLFLALYVATAGGHLYTSDAGARYEITQSLVLHGTPECWSACEEGPDGRFYGAWGIGESLLLVPFFLLALAVHGLAPQLPLQMVATFSASFLNPVAMALTCAVIY